MQIIKPPKLKSGDAIGVVAPAYPFPLSEESEYYQQYLKGRAELVSMGFEVVESKNLRKVEWWRAGSPKDRASDINEMYQNPEIKAVIAHDGANDCISVLEYLDYDLIRRNPKPFIGFSNITNIHSALFTKLGIVGFHMGLLTYELGDYWQRVDKNHKEISKEYFHRILTSTDQLGNHTHITEWESWRSGVAEGRLFGGNLSMLDSLIGTPYFPSADQLKNSILFWELDNSPTYRIERILTHLKYAGILDVISGMVVGKLVDMKPSTTDFEEPSYKEIVIEILKNYSFPILANVDFGHKMAQLPMPLGVNVGMDADGLKLDFLEAGVSST